MELEEFFRQIEEGELEPEVSGDHVNFYCERSEYGLIDKPRDAGTHYSDRVRNHRYSTRPQSNEWMHKHDDNVVQALSAGWIVPFPVEVFAHTPEGKGEILPMTGYRNDTVNNYAERYDIRTGRSIIHLNTLWAIDLPEGYSALIVSPMNYRDSQITVIPHILDADKFPHYIRVPVIVNVDEFRKLSGTPLVQVIPIKMQDFARDITVEPFSETELESVETEVINK